MDKMVLNINVFHAGVERWVLGEDNHTSVVIPDMSGVLGVSQ